MRTHTYRAATVQDAIRLAKEELGPDALIVEVRRIASLGPDLGRDGLVEIQAIAGETSELPPATAERTFPRLDDLITRRRPHRSGPRHAEAGPARVEEPAPSEQDVAIIQRFGVSEALAARLATACGIGSAISRHGAVARTIQRALALRDLGSLGEERIVAALVGPSGVGKTTTVAKLAAVFSAGSRARVALITTDTYRVGGIGQLKTFAELLQLPFYTVYQRSDLDEALEATADADLVLIDTPGCNPYDSAMLKEMRNLLCVRTRIDCYLTVAMPADYDELLTAAQRFALLNPAGMIATKLDETRRAARLIGLADEIRLPLSYVCAGPLVPDDIALVTPALLADLLLDAIEMSYPREMVEP